MSVYNFENVNILVVGDLILDKYHFGSVERISPEAPVPVIRVNQSKTTLGGAGNVASNISHLGANVTIFGCCGKDSEAGDLKNKLDEINANTFFIERDLPTLTKLRVIGDKQQIARLDFEEIVPLEPENISKVIEKIRVASKTAQAVIISDYGKGMCTDEMCQKIIQQAKENSIPVVIDPKGSRWDKYKGATMVTPNVKELSEVYGTKVENTDEAVEKAALDIMEKYQLENLIVTRSDKGMSAVNKEGAHHIPTLAKEVFDVSGAGDTVVATLAACLGKKMSLTDSMAVANKAAGIVVSKVGTAPVHLEELNRKDYEKGGHVSIEQLIHELDDLKTKGGKVVFTNGCFDILHRGHLTYLRQARELGDTLVVGLNSDASVKVLKGEDRPVNNQQDRAEMLLALEFVDYVIIFGDETPYELIKTVKPDILVKGGDYNAEEVVGREFSGKVEIIPFVDGYSTTNFIEYVKKNG